MSLSFEGLILCYRAPFYVIFVSLEILCDIQQLRIKNYLKILRFKREKHAINCVSYVQTGWKTCSISLYIHPIHTSFTPTEPLRYKSIGRWGHQKLIKESLGMRNTNVLYMIMLKLPTPLPKAIYDFESHEK